MSGRGVISPLIANGVEKLDRLLERNHRFMIFPLQPENLGAAVEQ